jgi:hypothetical protein
MPSTLTVLALVALVALASTSTHALQPLTLHTFESAVLSTSSVLVLYCIPGVGSCDATTSMLSSVERAYVDKDVLFATVDCDEYSGDKDICVANNVYAHPTLRYYTDGVEHLYDLAERELSLSENSMRAFVDKELIKECDINRPLESCNARAIDYVAKMSLLTDAGVRKEYDRIKTLVDKIRDGREKVSEKQKKWFVERKGVLGQILGEL